MVCRNCGNELRDDAKFCPHCGASIAPGPGGEPPAPYSAPASPAWEGPEGGGRKKSGLIIGVAVAVVAAVVLLVLVLSGLFSNPKKQVETAFVKSTAAYAAIEKKLGLPDVEQWQKDQNISQRMNLELKSINSDLVGMDLSALSGLGLGLRTDYDGKGRTMGMELAARWGEDELLTFQMTAEDDELCFGSPQFTGGTFYGVNTETLGADLTNLTGDDSMKDLSFNIFDLVDLVLERVDQEKLEEDFKEANKALWEQAKVKKTGAKTMDINGAETKTTAYQVVIPEEALHQYVDDLETMLSAMNYYELYEEMFRAMGMPREEIEEFLDELEELDIYGELADGLRDAVDEIGDLELEVCLSSGYVFAVRYEGRVDGSDLSVDIRLGGNEEYVDDLSVDVEADDVSVEIKSAGDHGLKSGAFTDETTVRVRVDNSAAARLSSELTMNPGKDSDNFQWKLGVDSSGLSIFVLETSGDYQTTDDYLSLDLEDTSLRVMGMEVCNLAFDYYVDCHPSSPGVTDPRLITRMSEQELMQVGVDIQNKAMEWLSDMEELFTSRLPQELLWALMGEF